MSNYLWVSEGKIRVKAHEAFLAIYPLVKEFPLNQIAEIIKQKVIEESQDLYSDVPTTNSLSNCKGQWNEFSFLYSAHISVMSRRKDLYIVKMGNESSIKYWQIYKPEARSEFNQFLAKLAHEKSFFIRCSTPDFVIIRRDIIADFIPDSKVLSGKTFFDELKNLYKKLKNRCESKDVIAFVSIKTSNRPDRRYQILYEANITKLASQLIHEKVNPLQFHVIGASNESDTEVFKAPMLFSFPDLQGPIIDSDSQIVTNDDLNHFWDRF